MQTIKKKEEVSSGGGSGGGSGNDKGNSNVIVDVTEPEPISQKLLIQSRKDAEDLKKQQIQNQKSKETIPDIKPKNMNSDMVIDQHQNLHLHPFQEISDPKSKPKPEPESEIGIGIEKRPDPKFIIIQEGICSHCGSMFMNLNEPIVVIPSCKHAFHTQCLQNARKCLLCDPSLSKIKGKRILLDHGDDPILTKQIEQTYGRQGAIFSCRDESENIPDFTFPQKNALTKGVVNFVKIQNAQFDKVYFMNQKIDFEKLLSLGITLPQLYHKCGDIKKFNDLKEIGLKRQTFENPQDSQIFSLVKYYKVDKDTLENVFDIRIEDMIRWEYHPSDLSELGWTMSNMIDSGMNLKMFSSLAKTQRTPKYLKKHLKMDKTHFERLKIKDEHIEKWNWDVENTKKMFGIVSSMQNASKKPKHGIQRSEKKPDPKLPLIKFVVNKKN